MDTQLIFPPAGDPAHPPLGIAALAGFLKKENKNVSLSDLNIASFYYLLAPGHLEDCRCRLKQRVEELEKKSRLDYAETGEYQLAAQNLLSAAYLTGNMAQALSALRHADTYLSETSYRQAASLIKRGMEFVSAAYYPVRWYSRGFSMSYLPTKSADVIMAIQDEKQNLFIPFYRSILAESTVPPPGLFGISINYYCQLIPGLTLARILKKRFPASFIVIGGGLICFFEKQWEKLQVFREIIDGLIPYEGELPLLALIHALENNQELSRVPGLIHFTHQGIKINPASPPPDINNYPYPVFDGLPLEKYLAPRLLLPTFISRGCYWGKCAFCSHAHLYRGHYRVRPDDQVIAELKQAAFRYQAADFYFIDEAIPPARAEKLAKRITDDNLPFTWFGEMRFEAALDASLLARLKQGGCSMLIFGLESAELRVLNLMHKGILPSHASRILKECTSNGIRTFIMFFTGFPTETASEAEKTISFIAEHKACIKQIAFTNFIMELHGPIAGNPAPYSVTALEPYPDEDLKIYAKYQTASGLTADEAVALLDAAKERSALKALIDPCLVSRSHLVFLPLNGVPDSLSKPPDAMAIAAMERDQDALFPLIPASVINVFYAFNFDAVSGFLKTHEADNSGAALEKNPTQYLFNPAKEKLVAVNAIGALLIKPCNGRYPLSAILDTLGEENKPAALDFYHKLEAGGFLCWEREM